MAEKFKQISKDEARMIQNTALRQYIGEGYVEPPRQRIYSDQMHRLDRQQLDQGVIALILACNLSGGSIGKDIDLYKLLRNYVWHPNARKEINRVVESHEREIYR